MHYGDLETCTFALMAVGRPLSKSTSLRPVSAHAAAAESLQKLLETQRRLAAVRGLEFVVTLGVETRRNLIPAHWEMGKPPGLFVDLFSFAQTAE